MQGHNGFRATIAIVAACCFVVAAGGSAVAVSGDAVTVHESPTRPDRAAIVEHEPIAATADDAEPLNGEFSGVAEVLGIDALESSDRVVVPLALVAGLNRGDEKDLLAHDARREIVQTVEEAPGRSVATVADDVGLTSSTARYHVSVLESGDLVRTSTIRGRERLYPAGFEGDEHVHAALADESTARILDAIAELEPVGVTRLADAVDRAPSTTSRHVSRLEEDGLLSCERDHRSVEVTVTENVRTHFATSGSDD